MLTKEEIELLELYKEQIEDGAKKKKSKKVDKPSGTRLFKSFAIVSTRVGSAYKLKKLLHRKSEDVLAWCVATAGNNLNSLSSWIMTLWLQLMLTWMMKTIVLDRFWNFN